MDSNTGMGSTNPPAEILAPNEDLETYFVQYQVNLRGELSGQVSVSGAMLRKATSLEKALQDVHLFLARNPCSMYPVLSKSGGIELVTPEFPPNFSGRALKEVQVFGIRFDQVRIGRILDHVPNDLPDNPDTGDASIS